MRFRAGSDHISSTPRMQGSAATTRPDCVSTTVNRPGWSDTANRRWPDARRIFGMRKSVTGAPSVGTTPSTSPLLLIGAMFPQGHDISRHVGELVVGKVWVRHAPLARH